MSKRTLSSRFAGKEPLAREVCARLGAANRFPPPFAKHLSLGEKLRLLAAHLLDVNLAPEMVNLYAMYMAEPSELRFLLPIMEESRSAVMQQIHDTLVSGIETNEIALTDPGLATKIFASTIFGSPFLKTTMGHVLLEPSRMEWVNLAVKLFVEGCRVANGPPGRANRED